MVYLFQKRYGPTSQTRRLAAAIPVFRVVLIYGIGGDKMARKIKIGALISGGGTNLQAIIDACESGAIDGEMVFVGTDNPEARGLGRAESHGISTFVVDYRQIIKSYKADPAAAALPDDYNEADLMAKQSLLTDSADREKAAVFLATRAIAEASLLAEMSAYEFDLLVLAGFMRNMTPLLYRQRKYIRKLSDYEYSSGNPSRISGSRWVWGYISVWLQSRGMHGSLYRLRRRFRADHRSKNLRNPTR